MLSQYKRQKVSEITSHHNKLLEIINTLTENGAVKTSFVELENENYGLKSKLGQALNCEPSQYSAFEIKINDIAQDSTSSPEELLRSIKHIGLDIKKKYSELMAENETLNNIDFNDYLEKEFYFNIEEHETSAKRPQP